MIIRYQLLLFQRVIQDSSFDRHGGISRVVKEVTLFSLPQRQPEDLFYKYSRNLSNDASGSPESSDPVSFSLLLFFSLKRRQKRASGCFEEEGRFTLQPSTLPTPLRYIASLTAIYPAKSYFRWKFIALARIEASFPDKRNKESAVPRRADLARSKNNWQVPPAFYRLPL